MCVYNLFQASKKIAYIIESKFPLDRLPGDVQDLIREHTATVFSVEAESTLRLRLPEAGWTAVPYVIRYEFALVRRDRYFNKHAEFEVAISRMLHPSFERSMLFTERDAATQQMLLANHKRVQFSGISAARLEMRRQSAGPCEVAAFVQFVAGGSGGSGGHAFRTPCWSFLERSAVEDVRERLKTRFGMDLG